MRTSFSKDELAELPRPSNGSVPRPPGTGKRGPIRKKLSALQQTQLLSLLRNGCGRELACLKMGISDSQFRNTWRDDVAFQAACRDAQKTAEQALGEQAYQLAAHGNTDIMMKLLDRFDRGHRLKIGRIEAEKNRQSRLDLAKLVLEHKAGHPSLVLALVPIISEACTEAVGLEHSNTIIEALLRKLDGMIQNSSSPPSQLGFDRTSS
jgi:hypothetical protein